MGNTEKIKLLMVKRKMTGVDLAEKLGVTSQAIYAKFRKDRYPDDELVRIAEALDCDFEGIFTMRDTGEKF